MKDDICELDDDSCELILYACPRGTLAADLARYMDASQKQCGPNRAHAYMPHCTLTGFFHDTVTAIAHYTDCLSHVIATLPLQPPRPPAHITPLIFHNHWHGLGVDSPWFQAIAQAFGSQVISPTRVDAIRLKEWLHISLAYGFEPAHAPRLRQLATEMVNPTAEVSWDICFYQRHDDNQWTCHQSWPV